jgi:hypothetical protein
VEIEQGDSRGASTRAVARNNRAFQTVRGKNQKATILQGVDGTIARGNRARQIVRGEGHVTTIQQQGVGNRATMTVTGVDN